MFWVPFPTLLFLIQRQHHHQHHQLCHQCVCWLCDLLHSGLHGTPPERPRVRGGRPWPRPGLCGLPRSPHAAPHFTSVVTALFLHAHPPGTWNSSKETLRSLQSCTHTVCDYTMRTQDKMCLFWVPACVVLSAGDFGDSHCRWDWYGLDHQAQDHHHLVCGHSWILTGHSTDNTGKSSLLRL